MIYLDNGATSFPKPKGMVKAMEECILKYCGNPGRSGHEFSMRTGEEVYNARRKVAGFFNIQDAERLVFTKNTTESINMGLKGMLREGDHVITTSMEHNSVLRPLKALERIGVKHSVVRAARNGLVSASDIEKCIKPTTRLIVMTAASNVTGTKMPIEAVGRLAAKRGIVFMVDGAQAAGSMLLDVEKMNISMLAFPGHKGLLGPLGTGGLYVDRRVNLKPVCEGGTGTESKSREQPEDFPEGFEAGTINAPGIIGLGYSAEFVEKIGVEVIAQYERQLIECLDSELDSMAGIVRYGPDAECKTGISLFNIEGINAEEVTDILGSDFGIGVRGGFHCAGLAHKTIGTWEEGAVRVSVGPFNTLNEIEKLTEAIRIIKRTRI